MKKFFISIIILMMIATIYVIYDNNRIIVAEQIVKINNLPKSFEGFTILQISDLHGKRFGKNQKELLKKINNCKYDILAITGDMLSNQKLDSTPFFEVLNGLKTKNDVFFVHGNVDYSDYDEFTGLKTDFGKKLESKACILLDKPYSIKRGNDTLWVSDVIYTIRLDSLIKEAKEKSRNALNENIKLQEEYALLLKECLNKQSPQDLKIAITHYPCSEKFLKNQLTTKIPDVPSYDLIIAGHYHGGQFRIPFYGAFYIPDPVSYNKGFLPNSNVVSGLNTYGKIHQYVSRGLGASGTIHAFEFRLFNPPEINLIKLVGN